MNINDFGTKLKEEEERILKELIDTMDEIENKLDRQAKEYLKEAKDISIDINPDAYLSRLVALNRMRDTEENRKRILDARDELYQHRLLLELREEGGKPEYESVKIGLHSYGEGPDFLIYSWKTDVFRHYIIDNTDPKYTYRHKEKYGDITTTEYNLLARDSIELRFTRVKDAKNIFPILADISFLEKIRGKGFFSDSFIDYLIANLKPAGSGEIDAEAVEEILYDEFLKELVSRRASKEFKNIVFSIQKKQGAIIQAPYEENLIIQGCAGSGKSMIMLHRLPLLLFDNQDLSRNSVYVITPSPMYIQLAENMRRQLEIQDIGMGTIEEYYNQSIDRYLGHKYSEYGNINYKARNIIERENYVYSQECIEDIKRILKEDELDNTVPLDKAYKVLNLNPAVIKKDGAISKIINQKQIELEKILRSNFEIVVSYFKALKSAIEKYRVLMQTLLGRKGDVERYYLRLINQEEEKIKEAQKEIDSLDPEKNIVAFKNREATIEEAKRNKQNYIENLEETRQDTYFDELETVGNEMNSTIESYSGFPSDSDSREIHKIYEAIGKIRKFIGDYYSLDWMLSRIEDKYVFYASPLKDKTDELQSAVEYLRTLKVPFLEYDYFEKIEKAKDSLAEYSEKAIKRTYISIMGKLGVKPNERGTVRALRCSPYLYLQILFQFYGKPSGRGHTILMIDEAQGIAPEEIRLLNNVNGGELVFNLFGDERQHIEGTKGVDNWNELDDVIQSQRFEMQENYRNASQITEYCNEKFGTNMSAINTPGKGVHDQFADISDFISEMITRLVDAQSSGLSAILVGKDEEADFIREEFKDYWHKFNDLTEEESEIRSNCWNILNISDAKGLEFSTVVAISGRMTDNEKYIAYTRALDELIVYDKEIMLSKYKKFVSNGDVGEIKKTEKNSVLANRKIEGQNKKIMSVKSSPLRDFFVSNGLKVVDNRDKGGPLWVIGDKEEIEDIIDEAVEKFSISGKYSFGAAKAINFKNGWYVKTDK